MKRKICAIVGYDWIPDSGPLQEKAEAWTRDVMFLFLVQLRARVIYFGGAPYMDLFAARTAVQWRNFRHEILKTSLVLVEPYPGWGGEHPAGSLQDYRELRSAMDHVLYLSRTSSPDTPPALWIMRHSDLWFPTRSHAVHGWEPVPASPEDYL